jgi:hypothetical protein
MNADIKKINTVKWVGIAVFLIGMLIAITCGAKVPAEGSDFPDTLGPFFTSVIISIIGLVTWHMKQKEIVRYNLANQDQADD